MVPARRHAAAGRGVRGHCAAMRERLPKGFVNARWLAAKAARRIAKRAVPARCMIGTAHEHMNAVHTRGRFRFLNGRTAIRMVTRQIGKNLMPVSRHDWTVALVGRPFFNRLCRLEWGWGPDWRAWIVMADCPAPFTDSDKAQFEIAFARPYECESCNTGERVEEAHIEMETRKWLRERYAAQEVERRLSELRLLIRNRSRESSQIAA